MPISREKEQQEQSLIGAMPTWASMREFRLALTDMTTQQYNAYVVMLPGLSDLSRTQAIALVQVREAFDRWRKTP